MLIYYRNLIEDSLFFIVVLVNDIFLNCLIRVMFVIASLFFILLFSCGSGFRDCFVSLGFWIISVVSSIISSISHALLSITWKYYQIRYISSNNELLLTYSIKLILTTPHSCSSHHAASSCK